jgi:hypothetical protein
MFRVKKMSRYFLANLKQDQLTHEVGIQNFRNSTRNGKLLGRYLILSTKHVLFKHMIKALITNFPFKMLSYSLYAYVQ